MEIDSLRKLFVEELKDLYSAEKQILHALPRIAQKVSNPDLKKALEEHVEVTRSQIERLDRIFEGLGKHSRGKKCKGMEWLLEESKEITMEEDIEPEVLDAALLAAVQKVEHYEIAGYGTVRTYAQLLGEREAAKLLELTLDEETHTDKKLTELAEENIDVEGERRKGTRSTGPRALEGA